MPLHIPVLGAWQRVKIILCAGYNTLSFLMAEGTIETTREANTHTHTGSVECISATFPSHFHRPLKVSDDNANGKQARRDLFNFAVDFLFLF